MTVKIKAETLKSQEPEKNLLTLTQVSMKYGLSVYTVRYWISKGIVQSVKIGRKHYVNPEKFIQNLVNANQ